MPLKTSLVGASTGANKESFRDVVSVTIGERITFCRFCMAVKV